jgi:hypothetical protein
VSDEARAFGFVATCSVAAVLAYAAVSGQWAAALGGLGLAAGIIGTVGLLAWIWFR